MIQQVSLNHGFVPYQFTIHKKKLDVLDIYGFTKLKNYLRESFGNCPDEHFLNGPRSSKLKFNMGIETTRVDNHEVSMLAKEALLWNRCRTAHSNVQMFMLSHDTKTFAAEVPLWLLPEEYYDCMNDKFSSYFHETGSLSGHIDLLRFEDDGKIWVWDYKPKAEKEKYASTQIFFYALMLSKRSGIPLDDFMCGYFDDKACFVFKPCFSYLEDNNSSLNEKK